MQNSRPKIPSPLATTARDSVIPSNPSISSNSNSLGVLGSPTTATNELARQKKVFDDITFSWQEKMFYEAIPQQILADAARYFQPQHYQDVIVERNNENLCGYPCCEKKPRDMTEFRILFSKKKVVDTKEMRCYCSDECMIRSRFYASQLSEEPVYLRGYNNNNGRIPSIQLLPMSQDLSQMLEGVGNAETSKTQARTIPSSTPMTPTTVENYVEMLIASLPKSVEHLQIHEKNPTSTPSPPDPSQVAPSINVTSLFKNEIPKNDTPDPNIPKTKSSLHPDLAKKKKGVKSASPVPSKPSTKVFKSNSVVERPRERMEDISITAVIGPADQDVPADDDASFGFISGTDSDSDYVMDDDDDGTKEMEKSDMSASMMSDVSFASPDTKPTSPDPVVRSPLLKMSTFGTIWTWLDRNVTIETRRYLSHLGHNLRDRYQKPNETVQDSPPRPQNPDVVLRREILAQQVLSTYALLKSFARLDLMAVEDGLVGIISTLELKESVGKWSDKELWILTLVLLRCLAWHRIPELATKIQWERASQKGGMTFPEVKAFVDVFKLDQE